MQFKYLWVTAVPNPCEYLSIIYIFMLFKEMTNINGKF